MILSPNRLLRNKEKALRKIPREKNYYNVSQLLDRAQDGDIKRAAATRMIELDPDVVWGLIYHSDDVVSQAALETIDSQGGLVRAAAEPRCSLGIRLQALDRIDGDSYVLEFMEASRTNRFGGGVVRNDFDIGDVILHAVRKLNDRNALKQIALDVYWSDKVRLAALERMGASPEELYNLATEGCLAAVPLLDQDALVCLIREAVEKATPLMFRDSGAAARYRDRVEKEGRKPTIADSAIEAIQRIEDDELAFTLARECMNNGELKLIPKIVADRFDDQPRRCQLGVHDFKYVEHYHTHYGEHITEYDVYKCSCCGQKKDEETAYWKW